MAVGPRRLSPYAALLGAAVFAAACHSTPPLPPAPLADQFGRLAMARAGWHLPDTVPDTVQRHLVAGDITGDSIADLALLMTRGDTATIYLLRGTLDGRYESPLRVGTTSALGEDVLFIQNGELAFGRRNSDDFIAWKWDRRHRKMRLIPEPDPQH